MNVRMLLVGGALIVALGIGAQFGYTRAKASAKKPNSVRLAWDATSGESEYLLHTGTNSQQYFQQTHVGSQTTYLVEDLSPGVTYFFAVSALKNGRTSELSNELSYFAALTSLR